MKIQNKLLLLALIVTLTVGFFLLDLGEYFRLEYLQQQQQLIYADHRTRPWQVALIYFVVYVLVTGLSLPGATVMTLAGGALFGLLWGTLLVSFASTVGATLAFLLARLIFRDAVQRRFGDSLHAINAGIQRDGAYYLFTLRLVPAFPFFVINLVMALTPIRIRTFYLVSQLGMLPATIVYVNAGTQLAHIESLRGILSPTLIASFTLLGIFPLIARKLLELGRQRKALRGYRRPPRFDRNLVVIGAGSAGLVSAYLAAALKAQVTLIERHRMGGDCLNTGCVPSKALIRSARFVSEIGRARELGMRSASVEFDLAEVMERVHRIVHRLEPHDSVERYSALGVDCIQGEARILDPYRVQVGERTITTRSIVIAAGARPWVPSLPGIEHMDYLTSDTIWGLRELPSRLVVLGGGPVGCELAQSFARLGSRVTVVEMAPRLLEKEDPEFSHALQQRFREEQIEVLTAHRARECTLEGPQKVLRCEHEGRTVRLELDALLVAVGRTANTAGYGLEALEIPLTARGTIEVNEYLQTRYPNVFACGDVAGPYQFTHVAAHQAWYATVNALFGSLRRMRVDYSVIPWATFTDPEIARVGLNETEARRRGVRYEVTRYGVDDLDRAVADSDAYGTVKVLTVPGKDRILGATIAAPHAAELIAELVAAMRHGLGLNKVLSTIHIYPTLTEANRYTAGVWKRAHAPQGALAWLARYHSWRRG